VQTAKEVEKIRISIRNFLKSDRARMFGNNLNEQQKYIWKHERQEIKKNHS
jgi:hypothetical protein